MAIEGELSYYGAIGEEGVRHAKAKPFSDHDCAFMLMQIGAVFAILPPPPAKVLECGCGVGWLTRMLYMRGYDCVGVDVSDEAIKLAQPLAESSGGAMNFQVANVENLPFTEEFDAVIYFDALHHCIDEGAAIKAAFNALKPGGMFIASEPGNGHAKNSEEVIRKFGVTEKDMPASHITALGKAAGFTTFRQFPRMDDVGRYFFLDRVSSSWKKKLLEKFSLFNLMNFVRIARKTKKHLDNDLLVMYKPAAGAGTAK
ncbi:class I SAM-dependent methyltransferase [Zavarzinella formosa]|uniref:class I SAM-dependent methyltransferase n=1 Tax=Zavarzinella formosa TaxID=360055 RepID=UPI0003008378|nr:class I SAM-dependent methyltransferase [Zavarzinella formosa]